jgi:hypothetical protein
MWGTELALELALESVIELERELEIVTVLGSVSAKVLASETVMVLEMGPVTETTLGLGWAPRLGLMLATVWATMWEISWGPKSESVLGNELALALATWSAMSTVRRWD